MKQSIMAVFVLLFSVMVNCNKDPLLTDLKTNKLIVVLKGTYESNNPMPWNMPNPVTEPARYNSEMQDDSVYECNTTTDPLPSVFMIDLSEIRLWDTRSSSYKFSNYRQTLASGLNNIDPLFNGAGYPLVNDDVPTRNYAFVALYIRKMLLNSAQAYVARDYGWEPSPIWDIYAEKEFPTYNFNMLQVHSFFDTLRIESTSINRVYPLFIPINDILIGGVGMLYSSDFTATVLEIRLVVKNYIKKYEQKSSLGSVYSVTHFHGLSDWLNDVERGDTVIGGNVLAVARTYIPELVGRISGTILPLEGRHVIAIPAGRDIATYTLNVDPFTDPTVGTPRTYTSGTLRSLNPCNVLKKPGLYTGTSINRALEYFLKNENYKYVWNMKIPEGSYLDGGGVSRTSYCDSYTTYSDHWNKYAAEVGPRSFSLPLLAVYAPKAGEFSGVPAGTYTIENVMPGTYEVYVANKEPVYGQLYYDYNASTPTEGFTLIGTATVSPGSNVTPVP